VANRLVKLVSDTFLKLRLNLSALRSTLQLPKQKEPEKKPENNS
jgi:hypothetical protein